MSCYEKIKQKALKLGMAAIAKQAPHFAGTVEQLHHEFVRAAVRAAVPKRLNPSWLAEIIDEKPQILRMDGEEVYIEGPLTIYNLAKALIARLVWDELEPSLVEAARDAGAIPDDEWPDAVCGDVHAPSKV